MFQQQANVQESLNLGSQDFGGGPPSGQARNNSLDLRSQQLPQPSQRQNFEKPPLPQRNIVISHTNSQSPKQNEIRSMQDPANTSPPNMGQLDMSRQRISQQFNPRASQYAGGYPHPQKRHVNELSSLTVALNRDKYKEELKMQILEKKNRDLREKQIRIQQELDEEERVQRERDELQRYYQDNRSEAKEQSQDGAQQQSANVFTATTHKAQEDMKGKTNMQTNMISNIVNPRQVSQDMAVNLPISPQVILQPPTKEEVDLQVALEQNMQVFNSSIAQMRNNHATLIKQYNEEIFKLKDQRNNAVEQVNSAQDNALDAQIQNVQVELDKIMAVIENTGESIISKAKQQASGIPTPKRPKPLQRSLPPLKKPPQKPEVSNGQQSPAHLKKKKVIVEMGPPKENPIKNIPDPEVKIIKRTGSAHELDIDLNRIGSGEQQAPLSLEGAKINELNQEIVAGSRRTNDMANEQQNTIPKSPLQLPPLDRKSLRGSQMGDANLDQQQPLASKRSFVKIEPPLNTQAIQNQDLKLLDKQFSQELRIQNEEIKAPLSERHVVADERQSLKRANSQGSKFQIPPVEVYQSHEYQLSQAGSRKSKRNLPPLANKAPSIQNVEVVQLNDPNQAIDKVSQTPKEEILVTIEPQTVDANRDQAQEQKQEAVDRTMNLDKVSQSDLKKVPEIAKEDPPPIVEEAQTIQEGGQLQQTANFEPIQQQNETELVAQIEQIMEQQMSERKETQIKEALVEVQEQIADLTELQNSNEQILEVQDKIQTLQEKLVEIDEEIPNKGGGILNQRIINDIINTNQAPLNETGEATTVIEESTQRITPQITTERVEQTLKLDAVIESQVEPEAQINTITEEQNKENLIKIVENQVQPEGGEMLEPMETNLDNAVILQQQPIDISNDLNHAKNQQIFEEFLENKKMNNEPIVIKKIHSKKGVDFNQPQYSGGQVDAVDNIVTSAEIVIDNAIDPSVFQHRQELRSKILETNPKMNPVPITSTNFIRITQQKLYSDNPDGSKPFTDQLSRGLLRQEMPLVVSPNQDEMETLGGTHLYKDKEINQLKASMAQSEEPGLSQASGVFTQDSKVNDYAKINSFYQKQKQLSDIAFARKGFVFGAYGEIIEQPGEDATMIQEEEHFLQQQPVTYNKNDPFGVMMRLRQSLSNTNKILFKQDNQRYIESIQNITPQNAPKEKILHQSSLEQLQQINIKGAVLYEGIEQEEVYDSNLYKDHQIVVEEETELQDGAPLKTENQQRKVTFELGNQEEQDVTANFDFQQSTMTAEVEQKEFQLLTQNQNQLDPLIVSEKQETIQKFSETQEYPVEKSLVSEKQSIKMNSQDLGNLEVAEPIVLQIDQIKEQAESPQKEQFDGWQQLANDEKSNFIEKTQEQVLDPIIIESHQPVLAKFEIIQKDSGLELDSVFVEASITQEDQTILDGGEQIIQNNL